MSKERGRKIEAPLVGEEIFQERIHFGTTVFPAHLRSLPFQKASLTLANSHVAYKGEREIAITGALLLWL